MHDRADAGVPGGLAAYARELSNHGRWGPHDELGTLNLIRPENRIAASRLVRSGHVVSVAHDLSYSQTRKNHTPPKLTVELVGDAGQSMIDRIDLVAHSVSITHLDALGHVFLGDEAYNGRSRGAVVGEQGLQSCSIYAMRDGIVTRGVCLDVAAALGRAYLEPHEEVSLADLELAERAAGVRVGAGDAVFVRVGIGARERISGEEDPTIRPGLALETLRWFAERDVAVYGGDCFDRLPSRTPGHTHPWHAVALVALGLAMIDNVDMEAMTAACTEEQRSEFLLVVAPLRIPAATGSAVNPLCIF